MILAPKLKNEISGLPKFNYGETTVSTKLPLVYLFCSLVLCSGFDALATSPSFSLCNKIFTANSIGQYKPTYYRNEDGREYLLAPNVHIGRFDRPTYASANGRLVSAPEEGRMMSDSWYSANGTFMARTGRTYNMLTKDFF